MGSRFDCCALPGTLRITVRRLIRRVAAVQSPRREATAGKIACGCTVCNVCPVTSGSLSDVGRLCGGLLHEKSQANESAWLACVTAHDSTQCSGARRPLFRSLAQAFATVGCAAALQRAGRDACGAHRLGACEHHDRRCVRCSRRGRPALAACRARAPSVLSRCQRTAFDRSFCPRVVRVC